MAKKRIAPQQASGTAPTKAGEDISKSEAIRRALDQGHSMAKDGVVFIRETYGLNVSPAVYSAQKSKIKAKKKKKKKLTTPAGRTQPKATSAPTTPAVRVKAPANPDVLADVKRVRELVDRHGAGAVLEMVSLFDK